MKKSMLCVLSLALAAPLFGVEAPVCPHGTNANDGFNDNIDRTDPNFVKASLLVVDPGEIMYSCFGHAVIRLECEKFKHDYCFSYESENILDNKWRFFWGDLKMGMYAIPTKEFFSIYAKDNRGVKQYALNLPPSVKQRLWKQLDGKVDEGILLQYDHLRRGCAQSILEQLDLAFGDSPVHYNVWPESVEKGWTRREIAREHLKDAPWTSLVMSAICGSVLDRDCPRLQKIILPKDLLTVLRGATFAGKPIISEDGVQVLPAHPLSAPPLITPMVLAVVILMLAVLNLFIGGKALDIALLSIYAIFGIFFFFLVCISSLPTNGWNWMLVPFNPLPLVFWGWRKRWGMYFAGVLVAFAAVVSFMPHRITEWPYIVFMLAFALLFAKPTNPLRSAILLGLRAIPAKTAPRLR